MSASHRRLGLLAALFGATATVVYLRLSSLRRAARALHTRIPRGAMAIRRESLVDLTVDGHPVRQTVFIAEASGETEDEILAGQIEDLTPPAEGDQPQSLVADPSEENLSGTATDVADHDAVDRDYSAADLQAEAEAVLAEATRIEEAAAFDHVVEHELEQVAELEASLRSSNEDTLDAALVEPIEDELADEKLNEEGSAEELETNHVEAHDGACPPNFPVKVRFATRCYHEPSMQSYADTVADACYVNVWAAEADGFTRSPLD